MQRKFHTVKFYDLDVAEKVLAHDTREENHAGIRHTAPPEE